MMKVKICGLMRTEDIAAVNRHKPDYAGFVFAQSRRQVSQELARQLIHGLDATILPVGVFVDEDAGSVAGIAAYCGLGAVQLHGNEDIAYIAHLRSLLPVDTLIIKALSVKDDTLFHLDPAIGCDLLLLDTHYNGFPGGGGRVFDWSCIENIKTPFLLAGGLTADNLPMALELLHPYGVDVSSGVETGGIKDEEKVAAFIALARRRQA